MRASDMLARLGGEEFCVVLPGTSSEGARRIGEKLRALAAALPIDLDPEDPQDVQLTATVSVGVATSTKPAEIRIYALRERADEALYAAKSNGRNQVRCSET